MILVSVFLYGLTNIFVLLRERTKIGNEMTEYYVPAAHVERDCYTIFVRKGDGYYLPCDLLSPTCGEDLPRLAGTDAREKELAIRLHRHLGGMEFQCP